MNLEVESLFGNDSAPLVGKEANDHILLFVCLFVYQEPLVAVLNLLTTCLSC